MAAKKEDVGETVYCNNNYYGAGNRGQLLAIVADTAVVQFGSDRVDTMRVHEVYTHELDAVSAAQRDAQENLSKALTEVNELTSRLGKLIDERARKSEPTPTAAD